jgi:hypothetical protein
MRIDGGCHCGALTYTAEIDPQNVIVCHCTDCQTLSGAAYRVNAFSREGEFTLLTGEPKTYIKTGESGVQRLQGFCPDCGTQIFSTSMGDEPKVYAIRTGTIHQREKLVPTNQIWTRSAQHWVGELSAIRKFEKQPV